MGTRAIIIILSGNHELARFYTHSDGYPEGHGVDLAKLCDKLIVNGIGGPRKVGARTFDLTEQANGMGCLAAQIISSLKYGIGGFYLEPTGGEIGDWIEYVYVVRGQEGSPAIIECGTHASGAWPFNMQTADGHVFTGTGKQWIAKYAPKPEPKRKRAKAAA